MSQVTHLASGPITRSGDVVTVELIQPDSMPAAVRIVWPNGSTITTPARYNEVASTAMRLLAEASTTWPGAKRLGARIISAPRIIVT